MVVFKDLEGSTLNSTKSKTPHSKLPGGDVFERCGSLCGICCADAWSAASINNWGSVTMWKLNHEYVYREIGRETERDVYIYIYLYMYIYIFYIYMYVY